MKEQKNREPSLAITLFLSWFYTGKVPKAPGTIGSLATLPLIYLLSYLKINTFGLICSIAILYLIAVIVTEKVQKQYHLHDPQWIVIDEVIGMLITWTFIQKIDFYSLVIIFVSFRFFDIVKIWPASYFDRLKHGAGTITDDVASALYAGIFSYFVLQLF